MAKLYDSENKLIKEISVEDFDESKFGHKNCLGRFGGCVARIEIDENVEYIPENAFSKFVSITDVKIPNSVKRIGKRAFGGCEKLRSVILSKSLEIIEESAFNGCRSLEFIQGNGYGVLPSTLTYIGTRAFRDCKIDHIQIPASVKYLGREIFDDCWKLRYVCCLVKEDVGLIDREYNSSLRVNDEIKFRFTEPPTEEEIKEGKIEERNEETIETKLDKETIDYIKCLFNPKHIIEGIRPSSGELVDSWLKLSDRAEKHPMFTQEESAAEKITEYEKNKKVNVVDDCQQKLDDDCDTKADVKDVAFRDVAKNNTEPQQPINANSLFDIIIKTLFAMLVVKMLIQ